MAGTLFCISLLSNLYDLDIEINFSSIYLVRIVEVLTFCFSLQVATLVLDDKGVR